MRIELNEAEIARAIERYVRVKNVSDSPNHEYKVTIQWRGKSALVDIRPAIPTLTETVDDPISARS
jgi:hypothetical protein